jgi:hypothetical protein
MIMFVIYYENMWYDLEWIQWEENTQKHSLIIITNVLKSM